MSTIETGTKFKITGNVYKGKIFTCVSVTKGGENDYTMKCEAGDGTEYYFSRTNLAYYGDTVKIISLPVGAKKTPKLLMRAGNLKPTLISIKHFAKLIRI